MEIKVITEKTVDIDYIHCKAHVMFWQDSYINDEHDDRNNPQMPCRKGEYWCPIINVDTGVIINWTKGVTAKINYKVRDEFSYVIYSKTDIVFASEEDYVPKFMCPKEDGYGDYIIMDIDENGCIKGWNSKNVMSDIKTNYR